MNTNFQETDRKASAIAVLVTLAFLALGIAACGSDNPELSDSIASQPLVPSVTLGTISAEEVMSKAILALENANSFEVEGRQTIVDENGTNITHVLVRKSSPERIYGFSETVGRVDEDILFDGNLYDRQAESLEQLQDIRWEVRHSRQAPPQYFDIAVAVNRLQDPHISVDESQTHYILTGTTRTHNRPSRGLGSTISARYESGPFTMTVDPITFNPKIVSYETSQIISDSARPGRRREVIFSDHMEFRSFNQHVEVSEPAKKLVDEVIVPTATAALFPTATTVFPPEPNSTVSAGTQSSPTATPNPLHPPLPTPVPPTSHDVFQAEIDKANPSNVFEVLAGRIVVYEACGWELDSVVTVRLFDLSGPESRGYMAIISIDLSDGSASVEHPGLTTGVGITEVTQSPDLMNKIAERADPVSRCK